MAIGSSTTCYSCETKHRNKIVNPQQAGADSSESKAQATVTSLVPVSKKEIGPKEVQTQSHPLTHALSLQEADDIFKVKGMSKADWKKFKKLYSQLRRAQSDKRKIKLTERILEHSEAVATALAGS
jgi:hypothetical protein